MCLVCLIADECTINWVDKLVDFCKSSDVSKSQVNTSILHMLLHHLLLLIINYSVPGVGINKNYIIFILSTDIAPFKWKKGKFLGSGAFGRVSC